LERLCSWHQDHMSNDALLFTPDASMPRPFHKGYRV
jgi:hypothetical protein